MKRLSISAALALAATVILAGVGFLDIPPTGTAVAISEGGKVVWVDGVSTNSAWTPTVKAVRESWRNVEDVQTTVATNYTYSVVWTNDVGAVITNVLESMPSSLAPTVTDFWTNTVVKTTATTNTVYSLVAAKTNTVTAGTTYIAPGDAVMLATNADDTARITIAIEK